MAKLCENLNENIYRTICKRLIPEVYQLMFSLVAFQRARKLLRVSLCLSGTLVPSFVQ